MSSLPWVRFFPSDWLAGTRGMSAAEMGVYINLIAMMYERGTPIAEDAVRLARLCGASNSSFKTILATLIAEGKIIRTDAGLWNSRVEKEQSYRSEKSEVGKQAANKRWQKGERKQRPSDARALQTQCDGNANQKPEPDISEVKPSSIGARGAGEIEISARSELGKVLNAELAEQIVEHREQVGAPLTAGAAKRLAQKLASYRGGAGEAADAMLTHGWRGFEPGWMDRIQAQAPARPGSASPGPPDRAATVERLRRQAEKDAKEATWQGPMSDETRAAAAQFLGRNRAVQQEQREAVAGAVSSGGVTPGHMARVAAATASKRAARGGSI